MYEVPGSATPEGPSPSGTRPPAGATRACPRCRRPQPPLAVYCRRCGIPLREPPAGDGDPGSLALSLPEAGGAGAGALTASRALNSLAALDRADASRADPAAAGSLIAGRYRIEKVLGRGGLGVVYRAWDAAEARPVALKVLLPELMEDPGILRRFRDQMETLTRLSHERIVPVWDAGTAEGAAFLVMPVMPGGALRSWIRARRARRRTRDDLVRALAWVFQAAEGLAYAHRSLVVHRDLKPENVLLDGEGFARIADFDLAKLRRASPITLTGQAVGTAYYMAPEQIRDPARVTASADLFSLGVVLYELVSGELPIGSFRPLTKLVRGLPAEIDEVASRLMAYGPEDRYRTASAAGEAIGGVLERMR